MNRVWVTIMLAAVLAGCGKQEQSGAPAAPAAQPPASNAAPAVQPPASNAAPAMADTRPVILAFGDSLTAGHGLPPGQSYADYLQKDLDARGFGYRVVNQGISGDTTDGGVARLDAALELKPAIVILELGANDGLRGLPVEQTRENLHQMIQAFQAAGAQVVLCGMTLPRNYGAAYIRAFEQVFKDLSKQRRTVLVPFFLEGVATRRELMQSDGLHPTAEGCRKVAENVMQHLQPHLKQLAASH